MKSIILILTLSLLFGCSTVVKVTKKPTESENKNDYTALKGIPFYVKKEVMKQETSYSRSWLDVRMTIERKFVDASSGAEIEAMLTKQQYAQNIARDQLASLNPIKTRLLTEPLDSASKIQGFVSDFTSLQSIDDFDQVTPALVENKVEATWKVDGSVTYYLNAPLPWFGSGSLTHEINDNGTLSKAASSSDTKLSDGLSALFPIKEYLTARHIDSLAEKSNEEVMSIMSQSLDILDIPDPGQIPELKKSLKVQYIVSIDINETGFIYIFEKVHPLGSNDTNPIPFDTEKLPFSRKAISQQSDDKPKPEAGNVIGLKGSITFPKE